MRIPSRPASGGIGFNMTPLIDVVFLLIVFFLLSSHLARQENQFPLALPAAATGQDAPVPRPPQITLNVLPDGTVVVAGRRLTGPELAALLIERNRSHGDTLEVSIRSDRGVPYRHIDSILRACTEAGLWKARFAVTRRENGPPGDPLEHP